MPKGGGRAWAAADDNPLGLLVGDVATFMKSTWEQRPAVFKATAQRRGLFDGLFCFAELQRLARICEQEGEPLQFGVDVNAARYVDGTRETPNGDLATAQAIQHLSDELGCTMQLHQPQRFCEELWRLLAALERQLGCLVGCNTYLTPKGTQGLAPHYDDVEIWVVQTEGSKRWRLYRPPAGGGAANAAGGLLSRCHLANRVSGDLQPADIGEPVLEAVLGVGDVLYLPRGTIHQAVAQADASCHLTISSYQRWAAADLLQYAVSVALANPRLQLLLPEPLKTGLPLRWLSTAGLSAGDAAALASGVGGFGPGAPLSAAAPQRGGGDGRASLARQLAAACRSMADSLEDAEFGRHLLLAAGDAMAEDFMRSRLPPHPEQLPPLGAAPTLADSVQCVGSGYFRLVALDGGAGEDCSSDCEEEHEHGHAATGSGGPPAWVRLLSCLRNSRDTHMMGGPGDEGGSSSDEDDGSGSERGGSGSERGGSGSEMSSEAAEQWVPGVTRAVAAAGAGRGREPEAEVAGSTDEESGGSEERGSSKEEQDVEESSEGGARPAEDLVFPAAFAPALVQLLATAADAAGGGAPLPVRAIALPDAELQLQVAAALWDAGVLRTVKAEAAPKQKQRPAKQQKQPRGGGGSKRGAKQAAVGAKNKKPKA